jgi:hypothetical protein
MVKIDSTKFGEITIDGRTYYSDMIVWWDGRTEYRPKSHRFGLDEWAALVKKGPQAVIIGTGQSGVVKIDEKVLELAKSQHIELWCEPSPRAVQLFNAFVGQGKKAVAVIHVTC